MSVEATHPYQVANSDTAATGLIIIDAHVHIRPCFNIDQLLTSAWQNFQRYASQKGNTTKFTGVLLLTETSEDNWFAQTVNQIQTSPSKSFNTEKWAFSPTAESCSLRATNDQGHTLLLMAGRQVVTAENLEVLALICDRTFSDGLPLEETIQAIQKQKALVVLPWGFGKWLGNRGRLISSLIENASLAPLFLGDNSGRPIFWPRPHYFQRIEQQGRQILPGTDPLPIASEASRPGSFGLAIAGTLDSETPGQSLRERLLHPQAEWEAYGQLETPLKFIRNQLAIRTSPSDP